MTWALVSEPTTSWAEVGLVGSLWAGQAAPSTTWSAVVVPVAGNQAGTIITQDGTPLYGLGGQIFGFTS